MYMLLGAVAVSGAVAARLTTGLLFDDAERLVVLPEAGRRAAAIR